MFTSRQASPEGSGPASARGTLEARQRAVVVAPDGVGLPGDLLDRG